MREAIESAAPEGAERVKFLARSCLKSAKNKAQCLRTFRRPHPRQTAFSIQKPPFFRSNFRTIFEPPFSAPSALHHKSPVSTRGKLQAKVGQHTAETKGRCRSARSKLRTDSRRPQGDYYTATGIVAHWARHHCQRFGPQHGPPQHMRQPCGYAKHPVGYCQRSGPLYGPGQHMQKPCKRSKGMVC